MRTAYLDYSLRRAHEERQAAAECEDNAAAVAHKKMADEYQRRVDDLHEHPELKQVL